MARWPFGRRRGGPSGPAVTAGPETAAAAGPAGGDQAWPDAPPLRPTLRWRAPVTIEMAEEPTAVRTGWLPRPEVAWHMPVWPDLPPGDTAGAPPVDTGPALVPPLVLPTVAEPVAPETSEPAGPESDGPAGPMTASRTGSVSGEPAGPGPAGQQEPPGARQRTGSVSGEPAGPGPAGEQEPSGARRAAQPVGRPAARWPAPALTTATPELVGPPEAPEEPFIPALALAGLPWEHGWSESGPSAGAAGNQGDPPSAGVVDPLGLLALGAAEIAPPPQETVAPPRPTVLRRATLAESRRRGLRAPATRPAETGAPATDAEHIGEQPARNDQVGALLADTSTGRPGTGPVDDRATSTPTPGHDQPTGPGKPSTPSTSHPGTRPVDDRATGAPAPGDDQPTGQGKPSAPNPGHPGTGTVDDRTTSTPTPGHDQPTGQGKPSTTSASSLVVPGAGPMEDQPTGPGAASTNRVSTELAARQADTAAPAALTARSLAQSPAPTPATPPQTGREPDTPPATPTRRTISQADTTTPPPWPSQSRTRPPAPTPATPPQTGPETARPGSTLTRATGRADITTPPLWPSQSRTRPPAPATPPQTGLEAATPATAPPPPPITGRADTIAPAPPSGTSSSQSAATWSGQSPAHPPGLTPTTPPPTRREPTTPATTPPPLPTTGQADSTALPVLPLATRTAYSPAHPPGLTPTTPPPTRREPITPATPPSSPLSGQADGAAPAPASATWAADSPAPTPANPSRTGHVLDPATTGPVSAAEPDTGRAASSPTEPAPPRPGAGLQRAAMGYPARQPLVYRDGLRTGPVARSAGQPVTGAERVPAAIADRVRQVHAIDVSDVVIDRGPAVSLRAYRLDARAFTEAGTVFLPAEAGDVGNPVTAALLGHELTHVAQQRELGADLPAEDTQAGQELEDEARSVERWLTGGPQPPSPLRHLRPVRPGPATTTVTPPATVITTTMLPAATASPPEPATPVAGDIPEGGTSPGQPVVRWSAEQGFVFGPGAETMGLPGEYAGDVPVVQAAALQELLQHAMAAAPEPTPPAAVPESAPPAAAPEPALPASASEPAPMAMATELAPATGLPGQPGGVAARPSAPTAADPIITPPPAGQSLTLAPIPSGQPAPAILPSAEPVPATVMPSHGSGTGAEPTAAPPARAGQPAPAAPEHPVGEAPRPPLTSSSPAAPEPPTGTALPPPVASPRPAGPEPAPRPPLTSSPPAATWPEPPTLATPPPSLISPHPPTGTAPGPLTSPSPAVLPPKPPTLATPPPPLTSPPSTAPLPTPPAHWTTTPIAPVPATSPPRHGAEPAATRPLATRPAGPAGREQAVVPPTLPPTAPTGPAIPGSPPAIPPALPAGPTIPAAVLAGLLAQTTMDTPAGTAVVPAEAVVNAVAQTSARPVSPGPAVPIADIGRVLASAAPLAPAPMPGPHPGWPQRAPVETGRAIETAASTRPWPPAQPSAPFLDSTSAAGQPAAPMTPGELTSLAGLVTELIGDEPPRHWLDMNNSEHLDELTAKLYDRLNDRLRRDVLVQRERSGRLMDSW